jgi:hypothetical protein
MQYGTEYKSVLSAKDLQDLYGYQRYNEFPDKPHNEISNYYLKILYICNIVLCLVTLVVSINEVVINRDCVVCSDSNREASYWIAILAIIASALCLGLNIFALATRSGFSKKLK